MAGCTLPEAGSMSWTWVPSFFTMATATGWPVSSSCALKTGPTTAAPSKLRRCLRPFGPRPKMAVDVPVVAAKTPRVPCQGCRRNLPPSLDFTFESSSDPPLPPAPSPQTGCACRESPARTTTWAPATMNLPLPRPLAISFGSSAFLSTLPVAASTCTVSAPAPSAAAATRQIVDSSEESEEAQKRALAPVSVAFTDHSCLPAMVRASTSLSRTTTALCFWAWPAIRRSTTPSPYSRCHVRSPVPLFQACTVPPSVTLMTLRPPERRRRMLPSLDAFGEATRRHCTAPSFSATEATTPDAEATKTLPEASAE
mmetsp:Transcript_9882/g.21716  ORF Transcript_9882/g.21716 Transcript_9882/m.21716 type:complete len:312 (-) Transcript_9882:184-1119(-)